MVYRAEESGYAEKQSNFHWAEPKQREIDRPDYAKEPHHDSAGEHAPCEKGHVPVETNTEPFNCLQYQPNRSLKRLTIASWSPG